MPQIDFKKLVRSGFRLSAFAIGIASALLSFAPFPVQPTSARATAVPASNPIDTLNPGEWYRVPNSNLSAVLPNPLPPGGTGPASLMVGDRQTLTMGPLPHDGTAEVYPPLVIGIGSRQPFELYVDLYTSPLVSPMMASDSGVLKAAPDNAPGRLLGRFKFSVFEATLNPPGTGPLVSVPPVPPGPNPGPSGNVGVITGPGSQSRPAVAVDPILPAHMAVASNDSASGSVRVSTTQNSGETWYTTILSRTLGNQTFFGAQDPSLAFDSLGKLSVVYTLSNLNDSSSAIVISESSDGINFNPPAAISFHLASDQIIDSRPVVAIKSGAGRYVAWDSLSLATSRYSINLARSEEGGLFGPVTTVVSNSLVSSPALAVNKSRVHIGWDNWGFNSVPPYKTGGSLMMTSSPNGAQLNFATPLEIAGTGIGFSQRIPAMPEKGVKPNLNLAVDPNDDSHIYAVFADRGNGMDIRLAGSADQGKTWQVMTVSNDGTLADQFSPSVAVDSNSYPYVSFYDTRLSSTFEAADLFMATFSTIVGVVNGDNIRANYGTLATMGSMPGNYAISAIIIDPTHRLPNYNVTITNSILTVIPAPIITLSATNPDPDDDNQRPQNRSSLRVPFGDQDLLSTSKAVTVTVGNIGTADLIISGLEVEGTGAGDFALTNKYGKTVVAGSNCTFTVAFTPSVLARRTAVITLTDNAGGYPGSEQKVNSSGNGVLSYAAYATSTACQAIALSDNASTDSFDSSRGSYADTKSDKRGDIAVNGNAALSERATVNGMVYSLNPAAGACKNGKPGISVSGKAEATGG